MSQLNLPLMSNSESTRWDAEGSQYIDNDNVTDITTVVADAPVGAEAS